MERLFASALRDDLSRSVMLGLKMVIYLCNILVVCPADHRSTADFRPLGAAAVWFSVRD